MIITVCSGLFVLNQTSGELKTALPLVEGNYTLTIGASDLGTPALSAEVNALVHISVLPGNNYAPYWIVPNNTMTTFSIYEVPPIHAYYRGYPISRILAFNNRLFATDY